MTQLAEVVPPSGEVEQLRLELRQLRCLYRLTDVVSRARSLPEVYAQALESIEVGLGASRSSILLFDANGVMRFVADRGLSDEYRQAVEGHSPWSRDARNPPPVLVQDVRAEPSLASYVELFDRERIRALAFYPLSYRDRLLGKFMVYYPEPRTFADAEVALAFSIAQHVAVAVDRTLADEAAQRSAELLKFLGDASARLAGSLDDQQTVEKIARALVPAIADQCVVDLADEDGRLSRCAEAARDPHKEQLIRELRRFPLEGRPSPAHAVLKTGQTFVWDRVDGPRIQHIGGGDAEYIRIVEAIGATCALGIPLIGREGILGVITCGMSSSGRRFEPERVQAAEEFARRAALALENAQLYAAEREARFRAEAATQSREDMLAVVSHDLRNPLSAITTSAALLLEVGAASGNEKLRRRVDTIQRAALRMERLIQDLLELSRIDAQTIVLELVEQPCGDLVEQALELMLPMALDSGLIDQLNELNQVFNW